MSTTTFTVPCWLKRLMLPLAPTFTDTELAWTVPGSALMIDVNGRGWPVGHTLRKLFRVASWSTVTFRATAVALAGTEVAPPATTRSRVAPWPSGVAPVGTGPPGAEPGSGRVSRMRCGVMPTNNDGWTVVAAGVVCRPIGAAARAKPPAPTTAATATVATPSRAARLRVRAPVTSFCMDRSPLTAPDQPSTGAATRETSGDNHGRLQSGYHTTRARLRSPP